MQDGVKAGTLDKVRCEVDVYKSAERAERVRGAIPVDLAAGGVLRCPNRLHCTGSFDVAGEVRAKLAEGVMSGSFGLGCGGTERSCNGRECLHVAVVRYAAGSESIPPRTDRTGNA